MGPGISIGREGMDKISDEKAKIKTAPGMPRIIAIAP